MDCGFSIAQINAICWYNCIAAFALFLNKMQMKYYHTVETFLKSNTKIIERNKNDTH